MKSGSTFLAVTGILGILAAPSFGQAPASANPAKTVSRTTKAVNYRRAGGSTRIDFQGTELMQQASGEAKVQNKGSRTEIDAITGAILRSAERHHLEVPMNALVYSLIRGLERSYQVE